MTRLPLLPPRRLWPLLPLMLCAPAGLWAGEGEQWAYTMHHEKDGFTAPVPLGSFSACRSAAAPLKPGLQGDCTIEDFKPQGRSASFSAACAGAEPATIQGEWTRTGGTASGTFLMQQGGQEMLLKQTARKLGPCTTARR